MGSSAEVSNEKKQETYDFEKVFKTFSIISLSIGIVIYSFTLGYFHRFEIPGNPSFLEAIRFYLLSVQKHLYSNPVLFVGVFCIFLSVYLGTKINRKNIYSNSKKNFLLVGCLLLFTVPFTFLGKTLSLFAPVVLAAVIASILFLQIMNKNLTDERKSGDLMIFSGLILVLCWWAFSTFDISFYEKTKLNTYFPNGFAVKPYEPSNLIWTEEGKSYWFSCQESRGVIYGTTGEEKIFIRTEMSSDLRESLCLSIE